MAWCAPDCSAFDSGLDMCSHYQAVKERERFFRQFGVYPPPEPGKFDIWPGYTGLMIRRPHPAAAHAAAAAAPAREAITGVFGLLPHWARDQKLARNTFNARSETAHEKPSFRDAWRNRQHCIIPVDAFFEPDWRSGKAVATRFTRADGEAMGLAGLWSWWRSPTGETIHSYSMLTINADSHALMHCFHKPTDEKRMVVVLPQGSHDAWLDAPPQQSMEFMLPCPADCLVASAP